MSVCRFFIVRQFRSFCLPVTVLLRTFAFPVKRGVHPVTTFWACLGAIEGPWPLRPCRAKRLTFSDTGGPGVSGVPPITCLFSRFTWIVPVRWFARSSIRSRFTLRIRRVGLTFLVLVSLNNFDKSSANVIFQIRRSAAFS